MASGKRLLPALLLAAGLAQGQERVACHYTYGGETKLLAAAPVESPYGVPAIAVGTYMRFRVVFQTEPAGLAAVKLYTYADRGEAPVLIHQASYPYPLAGSAGAPYGFTGLQSVYEPVTNAELQYWCRLEDGQ